MKVRAVTLEDIPKIQELHEKYYSDLEFPDFTKLLCGFVIEKSSEIVIAGGVEMIGEAVLVTNKSRSEIEIGKSLVIAQGACLHICQKFKIKELDAFVTNPVYARHLIRHGFEPRYQNCLSMKVPDGQK